MYLTKKNCYISQPRGNCEIIPQVNRFSETSDRQTTTSSIFRFSLALKMLTRVSFSTVSISGRKVTYFNRSSNYFLPQPDATHTTIIQSNKKYNKFYFDIFYVSAARWILNRQREWGMSYCEELCGRRCPWNMSKQIKWQFIKCFVFFCLFFQSIWIALVNRTLVLWRFRWHLAIYWFDQDTNRFYRFFVD